MALINCKECNKQISTQAKVCPNCGVKINNGIGLFGIVVLVFFAVTIYAAVRPNPVEIPKIQDSANTPLSESINEAPSNSQAEECDIGKITVTNNNVHYKDFCSGNDCTRTTGTITIENGCSEPVGVQIKITTFDENNNPVTVRELWPASIRNIPVGKEIFSADYWLDYEPTGKKIEIVPIRVKKYETRT